MRTETNHLQYCFIIEKVTSSRQLSLDVRQAAGKFIISNLRLYVMFMCIKPMYPPISAAVFCLENALYVLTMVAELVCQDDPY